MSKINRRSLLRGAPAALAVTMVPAVAVAASKSRDDLIMRLPDLYLEACEIAKACGEVDAYRLSFSNGNFRGFAFVTQGDFQSETTKECVKRVVFPLDLILDRQNKAWLAMQAGQAGRASDAKFGRLVSRHSREVRRLLAYRPRDFDETQRKMTRLAHLDVQGGGMDGNDTSMLVASFAVAASRTVKAFRK